MKQIDTWQACQDAASPALRQQVGVLVEQDAEALADRFYQQMLQHPDAAGLLSHQVVNERLHAMLARWLRSLFVRPPALAELVAMQQHIGTVHARIGVSSDMVSRGARLLKREIALRLARATLPPERLAEALMFVYEWIDLAIETMNGAYHNDASRLARADEAYRLFFLSRNLRAERDRQRSQLLEWANQVLISAYWVDEPVEGPAAAPGGAPHRLGESDFGLWLMHKAAMLFEDAPELANIQASAQRIETALMPRARAARDQPAVLREVLAEVTLQIAQIKAMLGAMFDRSLEAEEGHDPGTRLLSRRYFASVAKREIGMSQRRQKPFALLLLEVDGFDAVAQALGIDAAESVLADLADRVNDSVRAGDFLFRTGDHQFAALLVEVQPQALPGLADGLRQVVEQARVRGPHGVGTVVTACVGAALFDGHPDYQRLLDRAETALRQAQTLGPNHHVVTP